MTLSRLGLSGLLLAVGYAIAGGLYWLLLNVPESSAPMLALSLLLLVAMVAVAGVTTGAAVALAQGATARQALADSLRALPLFGLGLLIFAIIWTAAGFATNWWSGHHGEIDALALRYLRTDRTQPLHTTVEWILWLAQWGLGLSLLGGLTAAGALGSGPSTARRPAALTGLRTGVAVLPLLSVIVGVVIVAEGLWRWAYWRPDSLSTTSEMLFVTLKLAALYGALIILVAVPLAMLGRAARRLIAAAF